MKKNINRCICKIGVTMAYKLAEEDKLCGIEYPTYEGYKPIPKATCEMLETQCGGIEIVFNCEKKEDEKTYS